MHAVASAGLPFIGGSTVGLVSEDAKDETPIDAANQKRPVEPVSGSHHRGHTQRLADQ